MQVPASYHRMELTFRPDFSLFYDVHSFCFRVFEPFLFLVFFLRLIPRIPTCEREPQSACKLKRGSWKYYSQTGEAVATASQENAPFN
jgi:hypothetical protein